MVAGFAVSARITTSRGVWDATDVTKWSLMSMQMASPSISSANLPKTRLNCKIRDRIMVVKESNSLFLMTRTQKKSNLKLSRLKQRWSKSVSRVRIKFLKLVLSKRLMIIMLKIAPNLSIREKISNNHNQPYKSLTKVHQVSEWVKRSQRWNELVIGSVLSATTWTLALETSAIAVTWADWMLERQLWTNKS